MLKQIQQRTTAQYGVELGHGFNIKEPKQGIFGCVRKAYIDTHQSEKPAGGGTAKAKITTSAVEAGLFINGSLEINADFKEVVKISGKAHMDISNQEKKKSIARSFYSFSFEKRTYLDLTELKPADLAAAGVTHIVTDIFYGKGLSGTMTLTDESKDNSLSAGGELSVTVASIPISGGGMIDTKKEDIDKNYSFECALSSSNFKEPMQATDVNTYLDQIKEYFKNPGEAAIVQFTLTPLGLLENFKSDKTMLSATPFRDPLNSIVKNQFRRSETLRLYVEQLKDEIPQEGKYIEQRVAMNELLKYVTKTGLDFVRLAEKGNYEKVKTMVEEMTDFNMNSLDILVHRKDKKDEKDENGKSYAYGDSVKLAKKLAREKADRKRANELAARKRPLHSEKYYTLENLKFPGFFMNLCGGSSANFARIQLYANPGNADSHWRLVTDNSSLDKESQAMYSEFYIESKRTNKRIFQADDGHIRQNEKGDVFRFLRHNSGAWLIQVKRTGLFIDAHRVHAGKEDTGTGKEDTGTGKEDTTGKEVPLHGVNWSGLSSLWRISEV